jgi:uncharacterized protein
MKPFYFSSSQKSLFGIYHSPGPNVSRDSGIVLCQPIGDEYIQSHRAFRQLALCLAKAGFPVLRFDYYGCGDSGGDSDEGSIDQWRTDIGMAITELKEISGVPKVSLIGARLGATLAALVGFDRNDVNTIVLWEPIFNGKNYFKELIATHREWRLQNEWLRKTPGTQNHDNFVEILGFEISNELRLDLDNLNLTSTQQCLVEHLLLIEDRENTNGIPMKDLLRNFGVRMDYDTTSGAHFWGQHPDGNVLVPMQTLNSIAAWISKVTA